jgi:TonB family protein
VLVNVAVDANGAVRDAFVERAYPADALALSAEALAAVREWRFRVSAVASGDTRRALVPIEFRLESDAFATPGEAETSTPPLDNGDAPLLEKIIVMAQAK